MSLTLGELFCEEFRGDSVEFEKVVFWRCVHPRGQVWARLIWRLNPHFFEPDLKLIRQLKGATDLAEVKSEISLYRYEHPSAGFLRGKLQARVSGERLLNLASGLFDRAASRKTGQAASGVSAG